MLHKSNITLINHRNKQNCLLNGNPKIYQSVFIYGGILLFSLLEGSCKPINAQITADDTVSTKVNNSNNISEITGGTKQGSNLFHSFQEFSLSSGNTAFFNNSTEIGNIVSRVTGGAISNIDGLIRANGNANLILINPQGINFGANAQLDIGGSFLGSTADSLVFEDGTIFSATDPDSSPLLTVSAPIGLQLGQDSGAINVQGTGHNLTFEIPVFSPFTRGEVSGLKVQPGQTLGLVGGDISFTGGVLVAEIGKIELGSVAEGTVKLDFKKQGFALGYEDVSAFKNINFTQQALVDVSGINSGSVQIQGNNISLTEGSGVLIQNLGTENSGNLKVNAAQSLSVDGITPDGTVSSGLYTEALATGKGGGIAIATPKLKVSGGGSIFTDNFGVGDGGEITIASNSLSIRDRSFITTTTFGSGKGGDITLDIAESINLTGTGFEQFQQTFQVAALDGSLKPGTRGTGIFIGTAADGIGGNLQIDTKSLSLTDGAIIFSPIFTDGIGGDLQVKATDIEIVGSALQIGAGVDSSDSASAGNILIDTERLMIRDGGTVVNATFGDGAGGNIDINATEFVNLKNTPDGSLIFTGIYGNTSIGQGTGGDVNLKTGNLFIDNAFVTNNTGGFIRDGLVFEGRGDGGNISVEVADTIEISGIPTDPRFSSGIFTSSFTSGTAGNIDISTNKLLIRDGSGIETKAVGSGDGGDLSISASDSITLFGTINVNDIQRGGLLATSGSAAFPQLQANGASGNIKINTDDLTVQDGASIDVQSLGTGTAGNLEINVENSIFLNNMGKISAATNSNNGGDINIVADNVFWLGNSTTTATASNNANGGNINIEANNLVALESSKLTADAKMGRGGNININTQGLFICESCRISASSELGVDGVITINTLDPNPNLEIVDIPIKLTQPKDTVALACSVEQKPTNASKLTISGRGGLPPRPRERLTTESIVSFGVPNNQALTREDSTIRDNNGERNSKFPAPARNWYLNSQGMVVLTASSAAANSPRFNSPNCHVR